MPAGGDNKPKLQKVIDKAIASVETDTHLGLLVSIIALVAALGSLFALILAGINSLGGGETSTGFLLLDIGILIASVAFLTRKIKNVPDNH